VEIPEVTMEKLAERQQWEDESGAEMHKTTQE
jgi:hypothetical protein